MEQPAQTAAQLLRQWTIAEPQRAAFFVDGVGALTYLRWEERSNAAARGLMDLGLRPGDRVGLSFDNRDWLNYAVAYMGVLKAGGVAVPLPGRMTEAELSATLTHCAPEGVVYASTKPPAQTSGWLTSVAELEGGRAAIAPQAPIRPDDICEVLYTSGTTGRPKGVASTHQHTVRPLVEAPGWYPEKWSNCARGIYLHANSIGTAAGQLRLLEPLGPLGMTTFALPVFDAERYCELAAAHDAAVIQLVPAMALTILETEAHLRHDLSAVQVVAFGCAPLPPSAVPDLAKAFPSALLVNMYELSEARHVGTFALCGKDVTASAGRPRGATEVRIVGDDGRELPTGRVGEICVRWAGLPPQSYYRDPAATAAVFAHGWTRTGDAGRLDEQGGLVLVDRLKDVIISDGLSISSVEIEDVLYQHPAVGEAVVFGLPHRIHGEEVAAAVVLNDAAATSAELRAFVADRLAGPKVPRLVVAVDAIPRNRSGKPLKRQLRDRFGSEPTAPQQASSGLAGGVEHEETLQMLWAQVLGAQPGLHDDFFDLGGDSVRASQIAARICQAFGVRLTVGELFEHPTIAGLAAFIREDARGARDVPPPIRRHPRGELKGYPNSS
jgi:acyl-CoA synthetase (AMP-forming)/AMP-acid ligase II/acyl carrier protein